MTRTLILFRHAKADSSFPDDPPLSETGRRHHVLNVKNLKESGLKIDALFSSPLRRAQETAEILGDHFDLEVALLPELAEDDVAALVELAEQLPKETTTVFVGHAPTLAELGRRLSKTHDFVELAPGEMRIVSF